LYCPGTPTVVNPTIGKTGGRKDLKIEKDKKVNEAERKDLKEWELREKNM
jgi:hypothetical protein